MVGSGGDAVGGIWGERKGSRGRNGKRTGGERTKEGEEREEGGMRKGTPET